MIHSQQSITDIFLLDSFKHIHLQQRTNAATTLPHRTTRFFHSFLLNSHVYCKNSLTNGKSTPAIDFRSETLKAVGLQLEETRAGDAAQCFLHSDFCHSR